MGGSRERYGRDRQPAAIQLTRIIICRYQGAPGLDDGCVLHGHHHQSLLVLTLPVSGLPHPPTRASSDVLVAPQSWLGWVTPEDKPNYTRVRPTTSAECNQFLTILSSVPPYVPAVVLTVLVAIASDRVRLRGPFILLFLPITIAGEHLSTFVAYQSRTYERTDQGISLRLPRRYGTACLRRGTLLTYFWPSDKHTTLCRRYVVTLSFEIA